MTFQESLHKKLAVFGIALFCFGYFASYVPYSMMTKMLTSGFFEGQGGRGFTGFQILPVVLTATFFAMFFYLTVAGWWKYCHQTKIGSISIPTPRWYTLISGICTAGVIVTTTLAYTFEGVSIVFAMLLMRRGTLIIAPVVD